MLPGSVYLLCRHVRKVRLFCNLSFPFIFFISRTAIKIELCQCSSHCLVIFKALPLHHHLPGFGVNQPEYLYTLEPYYWQCLLKAIEPCFPKYQALMQDPCSCSQYWSSVVHSCPVLLNLLCFSKVSPMFLPHYAFLAMKGSLEFYSLLDLMFFPFFLGYSKSLHCSLKYALFFIFSWQFDLFVVILISADSSFASFEVVLVEMFCSLRLKREADHLSHGFSWLSI